MKSEIYNDESWVKQKVLNPIQHLLPKWKIILWTGGKENIAITFFIVRILQTIISTVRNAIQVIKINIKKDIRLN